MNTTTAIEDDNETKVDLWGEGECKASGWKWFPQSHDQANTDFLEDFEKQNRMFVEPFSLKKICWIIIFWIPILSEAIMTTGLISKLNYH